MSKPFAASVSMSTVGMTSALSIALLCQALVMSGWLGDTLTAQAAASRGRYRSGASVSQGVMADNMQAQLMQQETALMARLKANPGDVTVRGQLATVQADLFKLDAAEKNATAALAKDPNNAWAHAAMGKVQWYRTTSSDMTYRGQKDALVAEAEEHMREAVRLDGSDPALNNSLGEILAAQGKRDEARQAFAKALQLNPKNSQALVNMGILDKGSGDKAAAISRFNQAIAANSKNAKAHYYKGEALYESGQYHEALQSLNTALYLNRNAPHTLNKMGEALQAQGNQVAAIARFRESARLKPEFAPAYQNLGNLLQQRGDGELAISELRSALNVRPNHIPYLMQIGQTSLALDKSAQAVEYYNQALTADPNNVEAIKGLATAYQRSAEQVASKEMLSGNEALLDAETHLQKAIQLNPNSLDLRLALLKVQKATGATQLDTAALEQLASNPASNEGEQLRRTEALITLGRFQEADAEINNLITAFTGSPQRTMKLADILLINGDTLGAKRVYESVLASNPGNVGAQRGMNRIGKQEKHATDVWNQAKSNNHWYSKKDRLSAKSLYEEAVALNPRNATPRIELGDLYKRNAEYQNAIIEYKAYLQLMPNLEEGQRKSIERRIAFCEAKLNGETGLKQRLPWTPNLGGGSGSNTGGAKQPAMVPVNPTTP
jgi:tetratricopeptide (TPR) repeat protein